MHQLATFTPDHSEQHPQLQLQLNTPYSKSRRQVWQTFFIRAQLWQTSVFLKRIRAPGHHLKTVNGRAHVLHSLPYRSLVCKHQRIDWLAATSVMKCK